jgi:glyoxylase-like metal-dependent hydrolase (beta-lactamase superfamily II)
MIKVSSFIFNPFYENTYVVYDETGECAIIDPGCYTHQEENELVDFINAESLKPVLLLNTHCHVDHVMGNNFVFEKYGLLPQYNRIEQYILESAPAHARMFGVEMTPSPSAGKYIDEGDIIEFGNSRFEILFLPGHSPGSIAFYNDEQKIIIAGDVLFYLSIGRTDLPSGNHEQLITSIKKNLFRLDDEYLVYPGHGQTTTLGNEKRYNPFLQ